MPCMAQVHYDNEPGWLPHSDLASRLRWLRWEIARREGGNKALTVEEAAELCDLKPSTWYTWENGSRPQRIAEVVQKIADATGIDRDWLLWGQSAVGTVTVENLESAPDLPVHALA